MSDDARVTETDETPPIEADAGEASADETPASEAAATRATVEPMAPRASFWTRIDRPFVFGFLLTLGALAAVLLGLALSSLSTVLIYIAFALFAALGLDPLVRMLERRGLSRPWSVTTVILGFVALLGLVISLILPTVIDQIVQFFASIPGMVQGFTRTELYANLSAQFGPALPDLLTELQKFLSDPERLLQLGGGALQVGGVALQVGAGIASGISGMLIVFVLTLYFLATLPSMKHAMVRLAPARDRSRVSEITDQITDSIGGYLMGMVTLAFINAVLVFALYMILGLPFPPLMATVAFCITLIPLVGSVLFWIIGSGIALFTDPMLALIFALIYVVYMQVEAYVITPRVMNKAIAIPGSLVVIGALVGGTLLGLLGALVAVPVAASILIIINQVWYPRQDSRV